MFKSIKEFFLGKPVPAPEAAPYKVEVEAPLVQLGPEPVVEAAPIAAPTPVVAKPKATRPVKTAKAVKTVKAAKPAAITAAKKATSKPKTKPAGK